MSAMSKKHYESIARSIFALRIKGNNDESTLDNVVEALAEVFAADNDRFQRETFVLDCKSIKVTKAQQAGIDRLRNRDMGFLTALDAVKENQRRNAARKARVAALREQLV